MMFRNHQWNVTEEGLEAHGPGVPDNYLIDPDRLTEEMDRNNGWPWPEHLAQKSWVDIEAFIQAYKHALEIHRGKYKPRPNLSRLQRSFDRARRLAAENAADAQIVARQRRS